MGVDPSNVSSAVPNINGDTVATLKEQHLNVEHMVREAIRALRQATPHGRNYQTLENPEEAFRRDRNMWELQVRMMQDVADYHINCAIRLDSISPR